jgi:hypothetical protein
MAITHVKVTYSVQPRTAQRVQELAVKWGIAKSEVIRRAVDAAINNEEATSQLTPLQALDELMSTEGLSASEADRWNREIRLSRRASGRKRGAEIADAWRQQGKAPVSPSPKSGSKGKDRQPRRS